MSTLRTALLGICFILALGTVTAEAAVSYNAVLEWNGPYYRVINHAGVDQLVDDPAIDLPFTQPCAVAAREHTTGGRDVVYVVDSGHNRVQAFEANAVYLTDGTFTWQGAGVAAANDYDDNQIYINEWVNPATRWIIPHSETVVIDGEQWTWVASLTGFVAADKVYTIDYTDTSNAPEIVFPASSLTSTSTISLRYALTDYQGGGTAADGLGDVDYGTSNGASVVLAKIDEASGGPTSWQAVRAIALIADVALATTDDIFLLDPADDSTNQDEKLFYYTMTVGGVTAFKEKYDDVLTNPYGVAAASGGTATAAAVVLSGVGTTVTAASVYDASQVTGHVYTVVEAAGNVTVTDATTGHVLVSSALLADMAATYLGIPGLSVTVDNAAGAGSNTLTTTAPIVNRYLFVTDTGADRVKVITASTAAPTATNDWLPGDVHTMTAQVAGAGLVGATAGVDYYYTTPGTMAEDYTVWANAFPIKEGTLATITMDPAGTPVTWTRVDNLQTAGPSDHVYEVEWATGKITFGDGVHGAIPDASTSFSFTYTTTPDAIRYGSSGTGPGRFSSPRGIAARYNSSLGIYDLYVADTGNNRIQKFAFHPADGANNIPAWMEYVCSWNTASTSSDYLNSPVSLAVALDNQTLGSSQSCYLAAGDQGNHRVVIYKDTAAMSGGGTTAPAWDSSTGTLGNSLGQYMQVEGLTFLQKANDLDLYVADASRAKVTKYGEAVAPTIAVTNFSATGTCYPPSSSFTFNFTTTNAPNGGHIAIYYDTASTYSASTSKLCLPADSIASSATSATWTFADSPLGTPADGAAYYIFFRVLDSGGSLVASDQTTSSELFCLDSTLIPTLGGADAIDGDHYLYMQNGLARTINLNVTYPDSIIGITFSGSYDPNMVTIGAITQSPGWDVPDLDFAQTMFNQVYNNTTGSYQVISSVLGSQVGLVSAGPHTMAQIQLQAGANVIDTTTRFKSTTLSITTAASGMKDIHGDTPAAWRTQNVNLRFGYLGDLATSGSGTDSTLPHLVIKPDGLINFDDQMTFTLGWNGVDGIQDQIADIGPTTGSVPNLLPLPDGKWDVDDILAFTVMYSWAASQGYYHAAPGAQALGSVAQLPRPQVLGAPVEGAAQAYTVSHLDSPKTGGMMTVDLNVGGAENLSGALLNVGFDPSRLELVSVENAGLLDGQAGCLFLHREGQGWVEISATRLDKANPGTSESGTVATLTFRILNENAGDLDLTYDLRSSCGRVLSRGSSQLGTFAGQPASFQLFAAHPNPMQGATNIIYALPATSAASLKIFDVGGRCVRNLIDGRQTAGYHVVSFDGKSDNGAQLSSGIYFYRLQSAGQQSTRKLILAH